jgi:hypothetical protein
MKLKHILITTHADAGTLLRYIYTRARDPYTMRTVVLRLLLLSAVDRTFKSLDRLNRSNSPSVATVCTDIATQIQHENHCVFDIFIRFCRERNVYTVLDRAPRSRVNNVILFTCVILYAPLAGGHII